MDPMSQTYSFDIVALRSDADAAVPWLDGEVSPTVTSPSRRGPKSRRSRRPLLAALASGVELDISELRSEADDMMDWPEVMRDDSECPPMRMISSMRFDQEAMAPRVSVLDAMLGDVGPRTSRRSARFSLIDEGTALEPPESAELEQRLTGKSAVERSPPGQKRFSSRRKRSSVISVGELVGEEQQALADEVKRGSTQSGRVAGRRSQRRSAAGSGDHPSMITLPSGLSAGTPLSSRSTRRRSSSRREQRRQSAVTDDDDLDFSKALEEWTETKRVSRRKSHSGLAEEELAVLVDASSSTNAGAPSVAESVASSRVSETNHSMPPADHGALAVQPLLQADTTNTGSSVGADAAAKDHSARAGAASTVSISDIVSESGASLASCSFVEPMPVELPPALSEEEVKQEQEARATELIRDLYQQRAPKKLAQVMKIVKESTGSRWDFYVKCCEKYGETPIDVSETMRVQQSEEADCQRKSSVKTCRYCAGSYTGFGDTCSTCRASSPRGSVLQCRRCGAFFKGFRGNCEDCETMA